MEGIRTREYRKIRKLTSKNKTGDAYGITIPRVLAEKFPNTLFKCSSTEDCIILHSGCGYNGS